MDLDIDLDLFRSISRPKNCILVFVTKICIDLKNKTKKNLTNSFLKNITTCWDLLNKYDIFDLENRRKVSHFLKGIVCYHSSFSCLNKKINRKIRYSYIGIQNSISTNIQSLVLVFKGSHWYSNSCTGIHTLVQVFKVSYWYSNSCPGIQTLVKVFKVSYKYKKFLCWYFGVSMLGSILDPSSVCKRRGNFTAERGGGVF
jgi:hypothetical protein